MATKRINIATINPNALATLSDMNVAYKSTCATNARYKALIDTVDIKIAEVIEARKNALDSGKSLAEVEVAFPRLDLDTERNRLVNERTEVIKGLNALKASAIKSLSDDLWVAYMFACEKGIMARPNKGSHVTVKGKKSTTIYEVSTSFTQLIKDYAIASGFCNVENENALNKFADIIRTRCSGMIKDSKGHYLKYKTKAGFKECFLLAVLQYGINLGVFECSDENYTITLKKYE